MREQAGPPALGREHAHLLRADGVRADEEEEREREPERSREHIICRNGLQLEPNSYIVCG